MPLIPNPTSAPNMHPAFRMILPYLRPIERLILDPETRQAIVAHRGARRPAAQHPRQPARRHR